MATVRRGIGWRLVLIALAGMLVLAASVSQAQGEAAGNDPGAAAVGET